MVTATANADTANADYALDNAEAVSKYRVAADVANKAMLAVIAACTPGAKVMDVCALGDRTIADATSKVVPAKTKMPHGVAFPTTISVNHIVCHFSPLPSDPEAQAALADGDLVKVQLGAHMDGLPAITAHSFVIGATKEAPATGRKADALLAAYYASEAALRLIKPGVKNTDVTKAVQTCATAYNCLPVQGQISHPMARNDVEHGTKSIVLNPSPEVTRTMETSVFQEGEVWLMDVVVTTGADGKTRESSTLRTTVFKRSTTQYQLRMKASRTTFAEVCNKFGSFPFSLRAMEDERRARMGIVECAKTGVVSAYPVHEEKAGEFVAQFMFTTLLLPGATNATRLIPSHFDPAVVQSEHKIEDDEVKSLLSQSVSSGKKKRNRKGKSAAAGGKVDEAEGDKVDA